MQVSAEGKLACIMPSAAEIGLKANGEIYGINKFPHRQCEQPLVARSMDEIHAVRVATSERCQWELITQITLSIARAAISRVKHRQSLCHAGRDSEGYQWGNLWSK